MIGLLDPVEEKVYRVILDGDGLSIKAVQRKLKGKGLLLSHEKVRLVVYSLWRKGLISIKVRGRERIVYPRPNIEHDKRPSLFRTIEIQGDDPQYIIIEKHSSHIRIIEYRWNGNWQPTNILILPIETILHFTKALMEGGDESGD